MSSSRPSSKPRKTEAPLPSHLDVTRELCQRSLYQFVKRAWPCVESRPFVDGWHIGAVCEHLEAVSRGQLRQLLINEPPRHTKSLIISVLWPAWEWLERPETQWLFASYAQQLSLRDSVRCRRVIESPWYQQRWGDVFQLHVDQNTKGRFDNDRSGYRIASSVGSAITGDGGDIVVCDDPHNREDIHSDTIREGVIEWWDQTMSTRLNDPQTGRMVVVMQRLHVEDLAGHLLKTGEWEHLCLPARFEPERKCFTSIGWQDPRTKPGELLWPQRFTEAELSKLERSLGSSGAAGQLQQRPTKAKGNIFQRGWWKFYREMPKLEVKCQSWDMAFKKKKDTDYVVGLAMGRAGADVYVYGRSKARRNFPETITAVKAFSVKHRGTRAKYVEDKANGPAVVDTLERKVPGLILVNPEGGKEARAHACSPYVEAGNCWLPHPDAFPEDAEWVDDFITQLADFPSAPHDDDVDAFTQGCLKLMDQVDAAGDGIELDDETDPEERKSFWR